MDSEVLGIERRCPWCSMLFLICFRCWRNHRYCSEFCSVEGRKRSHRESQKVYSKSSKGKESRKISQEMRRGRPPSSHKKNNEADHSSKVLRDCVSSRNAPGLECGFCACLLTKVVRGVSLYFSFRSFKSDEFRRSGGDFSSLL